MRSVSDHCLIYQIYLPDLYQSYWT